MPGEFDAPGSVPAWVWREAERNCEPVRVMEPWSTPRNPDLWDENDERAMMLGLDPFLEKWQEGRFRASPPHWMPRAWLKSWGW